MYGYGMKIIKNIFFLMIMLVSFDAFASSLGTVGSNIKNIADIETDDSEINPFAWINHIKDVYIKVVCIGDHLYKILQASAKNSVSKTKQTILEFANDDYLLKQLINEDLFTEEQGEQFKKSITIMAKLADEGNLKQIMSLLYDANYQATIYNEKEKKFEKVRTPMDISKDQLNFLGHNRVINNLYIFLEKKKIDVSKEEIIKIKELIDDNNFSEAYKKLIYLDLGNTYNSFEELKSGDFNFGSKAISFWNEDMLLLLDTYDQKYKPQMYELLGHFEKYFNKIKKD